MPSTGPVGSNTGSMLDAGSAGRGPGPPGRRRRRRRSQPPEHEHGRSRRPRRAGARRLATGDPPTSSRSTGSASGWSTLRTAAPLPEGAAAGSAPCGDRLGDDLAAVVLASPVAPRRLGSPAVRSTRSPASTSRSRFSTNWREELGRHVADHAPPELRDLAGDREVGLDVDARCRRRRRSASSLIVADALPWPRVSRPDATMTAVCGRRRRPRLELRGALVLRGDRPDLHLHDRRGTRRPRPPGAARRACTARCARCRAAPATPRRPGRPPGTNPRSASSSPSPFPAPVHRAAGRRACRRRPAARCRRTATSTTGWRAHQHPRTLVAVEPTRLGPEARGRAAPGSPAPRRRSRPRASRRHRTRRRGGGTPRRRPRLVGEPDAHRADLRPALERVERGAQAPGDPARASRARARPLTPCGATRLDRSAPVADDEHDRPEPGRQRGVERPARRAAGRAARASGFGVSPPRRATRGPPRGRRPRSRLKRPRPRARAASSTRARCSRYSTSR